MVNNTYRVSISKGMKEEQIVTDCSSSKPLILVCFLFFKFYFSSLLRM